MTAVSWSQRRPLGARGKIGSSSTNLRHWVFGPDPLLYLTGSMRCSYGVSAHMTYGFAVSGFASRG